MQQLFLRYAVLSASKRAYKSYSEVFMFKFPMNRDFNSKFDVYDSFCSFNSWKLGSLFIYRLKFRLNLSCSEWGDVEQYCFPVKIIGIVVFVIFVVAELLSIIFAVADRNTSIHASQTKQLHTYDIRMIYFSSGKE